MHSFLETDRLIIRPLSLNDCAFILELLNSKGWIEFIGDRKVFDLNAAQAYINKILEKENFSYNVFEIKETKEPIGIVTFLYRDEFDCISEYLFEIF